jgi:hypothetical protein
MYVVICCLVRLQPHRHLWADYPENVWASTSHNPMGLHGMADMEDTQSASLGLLQLLHGHYGTEHYWPSLREVRLTSMDQWCGIIVSRRKKKKLWERSIPVALCPSRISHEVAQNWTRASVVKRQHKPPELQHIFPSYLKCMKCT